MNCPTEIEIPNLTEPCDGNYISTNCLNIPEANATLSLPVNATQTEVNDALTAALIYKEQQIVALQALVGGIDTSVVHRTGNETVNGVKTFNETPVFSTGEINIYDSPNGATTRTIAADSAFYHINGDEITTFYVEPSYLAIGKSNSISAGISAQLLTSSRNYNLPNQSGTLALTSDIAALQALINALDERIVTLETP